MTNIDPADLEALIHDGDLNLDALFDHRSVKWENLSTVARYTTIGDGQPFIVPVIAQAATRCGITVYRWSERFAVASDVHLAFEDAIDEAHDRAESADADLDEEDLAQQIIDTGYFQPAGPDCPVTIDDVLRVCRGAVEFGMLGGYLLISRYPSSPATWHAQPPLQSQERWWVAIHCAQELVSHAAYVLLREIKGMIGEVEP